ncbi:MAG TPA: ATP-binding protein [Myxococcota bacterium]|nr:ATP-binding protein [Myxococcota bacterium]HQK49759.1 ATP-binding protein [Myxococcota bacterium]
MEPQSDRGNRFQRGWGPWIAFALLLVGIAWIPTASHRFTSEMLLQREVERHQFLGRRVSAWLQEENLHLIGAMGKLAGIVSREGSSSMVTALLVQATWESLHPLHAVRGLVMQDPVGQSIVVLGDLPESWAERTGAFLQGLRDRPGIPEGVVLPGDPLLWVLGMGAAGPGESGPGTICLVVDLSSVFRRLIGIEARDLDVSFTLMDDGGNLLLHSGTGMRDAGSRLEGCRRCHEPVPRSGGAEGRTLLRYPVAGVERLVVQVPVDLQVGSWTLWASTPTRDLLRPLSQQQISLLVFTLLLLLLLLGLGLIVRRQQIERMGLQARVAEQERVLRLVEEQERLRAALEESRRMATVGQMVARVAHEVKNPLQYMGTGLELLGRRARDQESLSLVEDLRTGMRTLNAIVQELLDFSRPMRLHRTRVDLGALLDDVVARSMDLDGPPVTRDSGETLPEVVVDVEKIRQVLWNLVQNAREAIRDGGKAGRVVLRGGTRVERGEGAIFLEVQDDGPGIAPEVLERVFEPFFTTKTHGSGLGLAVVQRIVREHGGRLEVQSRPGEGTTFRVILPVEGGDTREPRWNEGS